MNGHPVSSMHVQHAMGFGLDELAELTGHGYRLGLGTCCLLAQRWRYLACVRWVSAVLRARSVRQLATGGRH